MSTTTAKDRFAAFNLDPALAEMVEASPPELVIEGILRLEDPDHIPPYFNVVSRFNRICTGRFSASHTWTIRRHPNVVSLKAARPLGTYQSEENPSALVLPGEIGTGTNRPLPFTGRGCIVAALDFGLDFAHPNFLNPDGTTRLVAFWHQGATYNPSHPNRFGYGRVYSREEINAALRTSDPYHALEDYHPGISDSGKGSHGTHTLDIAAGNADLMFVHLSTPRLGVVGDLGDSVRLLEALDFVDTTARLRLLPWVANVSVGRTGGSHDGTSLVEQGMHELLRLGPDRAIVQSAGNYRSADLAVEGWLRDGEHRDLGWIIDPRDTTGNEIDVWYSGKDRFVVAIRPPEGQDFVEVTLGDVADLRHKGDLVGRIYHRRDDPNARDNHVEGILYPGAPPGVWTVRLIGDYVISGRFHAWIERDLARAGAQSRFDSEITSQSYTLGTIATSPLVITVGAYDANAEGTPLAPFSSCGPTRDERRDKPELLAPGVDVVAARSIPRGALRQEGLLIARSGTSMAAPHVTRAVAAMLAAADRPVSIDEIRDCLKGSAEPVADREHAACCAWGRLNAAGAIREIRGLKRAALVSAPQGDALAPEPPVTTSGPAISDAATGDFASASEEQEIEEQEIEMSKDEGVLMNGVAVDRFLERAEHAVRSSYGGRRESETSFLQRLLRELGHGAPAGLSPAGLFRAALHDGPLIRSARDRLRVLVVPSQRPADALRAGDWMVRAIPGTGDVGHVSVLASDDLLTQSMLATEGIAAESIQPGYYGLVIEAGAFPHSRVRPFARRLLDSRGRVPPNTVFLRPEGFQFGAAIPTPEVALPVGQGGRVDIEASPSATRPPAPPSSPAGVEPTAVPALAKERKVTRIMLRMFFETDKTFLLPSAMRSIRLLNRIYKDNPGGEVLVVGHTDTVGSQDYNLQLSKRRAQNMAAYLEDKVDIWTAYYRPQTISKQWGTREDQYMLSALPGCGEPFYTGTIDGNAGPSTKDAIIKFQKFSNANRGTTLTVDGIAGPDTRRELVKTYMEIDGTTLPAGTRILSQGCGEFHPEVLTGDNVPEARNRRTEVFFFPDKIDPPMPVGGGTAPGCIEYPQWRSRAGRTIDFMEESILLGGGFPPSVFSSERSFPKPSALPFLREVAKRAAGDPAVQVLVFGNTDATGTDAVNAELSLARARAVAALLTGDEAFLRARFSTPDPLTTWDWEEAQFMMSALAIDDDLFYAGVIDGDPGPLSANAVGRFQTFHDLEVTEELDGPTLDRLVHEYALLIGPERPAAAQMVVHGGGSWHPPRSLGENSRPLPLDELPNEAHPGPRRVEVFLAPGGLEPPLSCCPATKHAACAAHEAWCRKVRDPIAITRNFLMPIRLVDANRGRIAKQAVELFEHTDEADEKIAALTTNSAGLIFLQAPPGFYSLRTTIGGQTFAAPFRAHADEVGGMTIHLAIEVIPDDRLKG
jgi:outer membrane protein OmpA-like peptidoglycan-associated protein/subtilisin family serine protease